MRKIVSNDDIKNLLSDFEEFLRRKIVEKGDRSFISTHEISGAVSEEFDEFKDAVRDNNTAAAHDELYDTAVACLWGAVSIQKGVEW